MGTRIEQARASSLAMLEVTVLLRRQRSVPRTVMFAASLHLGVRKEGAGEPSRAQRQVHSL